MKALVVGCSFTRGHGLVETTNDPKLWVNQFLAHLDPGCYTINLAQTGKNNHWIFTEAYCALMQQDFDLVIIGWTHQSRLNFTVGLETYSTDTMFTGGIDININPGITVSKEWLKETGNRLKKIQNDHWGLVDLIKYVNILYDKQVTTRGKNLLFVNSLVDISNNYFIEKNSFTPSDLSKYQQNLLNVDSRDDEEIKKLYQLTHQHYKNYGGIRSEHWLNLYNSLLDMKIDNVSKSDLHPGYKSQDLYAKYLINQYNEKMHYNNSR
jgi:hypothetical protein